MKQIEIIIQNTDLAECSINACFHFLAYINWVVSIDVKAFEIEICTLNMVRFFSRLKLFRLNIFHLISEKEKFQLYLGICFRPLLWTLSFTVWSVPWGIIVSTKGIGNWKQYPFIGNRGNISLILNWLVFFLMWYNTKCRRSQKLSLSSFLHCMRYIFSSNVRDVSFRPWTPRYYENEN